MMTIRRQLTVEAPVERSFRVFTASMGAWWPKEHHIGGTALRDCVIEPKVNGRWYEVGEDGTTCEVGQGARVGSAPEAGARVAARSGLQVRPDAGDRGRADVHRARPKRTRVDFEHRNLERFGEAAERLLRDMDTGWGQILESYQRTAVSEAA